MENYHESNTPDNYGFRQGFLSPAKPGKIIWGIGPQLNLPPIPGTPYLIRLN